MKVNPNELPAMLRQYLFDDTYGVQTEEHEFSWEELLDCADYVKRLDKAGEWWGFAYYGGNKKKERTALTRYIEKCKEEIAEKNGTLGVDYEYSIYNNNLEKDRAYFTKMYAEQGYTNIKVKKIKTDTKGLNCYMITHIA